MMEQEIEKCVELLQAGKVILYPTDTVWGIGCDATNDEAVQRIYQIKQRPERKCMIILLDSFERLPYYVEHIPLIAWDLVPQISRPTTVIYSTARNLPDRLIHNDGTIAIRVVQHDFCRRLIKKLGHPIVSTSANFAGQETPKVFEQIDPAIIKLMDYVVPQTYATSVDYKPSRLIKFVDDYNFTILRD